MRPTSNVSGCQNLVLASKMHIGVPKTSSNATPTHLRLSREVQYCDNPETQRPMLNLTLAYAKVIFCIAHEANGWLVDAENVGCDRPTAVTAAKAIPIILLVIFIFILPFLKFN